MRRRVSVSHHGITSDHGCGLGPRFLNEGVQSYEQVRGLLSG